MYTFAMQKEDSLHAIWQRKVNFCIQFLKNVDFFKWPCNNHGNVAGTVTAPILFNWVLTCTRKKDQ